MDLKHTPLYQEHLCLGARMAEFAGWEMPIQYSGIIDEHTHTRAKAGLFDICHMGEFIIKGENAPKDVDYLITCRTNDMAIGKCRYGFLLNKDGGILDDLVAFKIDDDEFMLVVNAATVGKDKRWISSHLSKDTKIEDISEKIAKFDLQGPLSPDTLSIYTDVKLSLIKKYNFIKGNVCGIKTLISRTGYTGELGYELYFPREKAVMLWKRFLENKDVKPIGLGARDTLRLEMGYSLYGHDIDENHTPLEANLEKFVYMDKSFIGKDALLNQKGSGLKRILVGFISEGRRSPRPNFDVIYNNKIIGKVTSASFSPCLKKAIGLCYVDNEKAGEGNEIIISNGDILIKAVIKKPPFYQTRSL